MGKGKQATKFMSPTKAIMQFRLADAERQVKMITEKHNLLAQQVVELTEKHNAANDLLKMTAMAQGRLIKMVMVMEELIETKLQITPDDVTLAEQKIADRVADNERTLQAMLEQSTKNAARAEPSPEAGAEQAAKQSGFLQVVKHQTLGPSEMKQADAAESQDPALQAV